MSKTQIIRQQCSDDAPLDESTCLDISMKVEMNRSSSPTTKRVRRRASAEAIEKIMTSTAGKRFLAQYERERSSSPKAKRLRVSPDRDEVETRPITGSTKTSIESPARSILKKRDPSPIRDEFQQSSDSDEEQRSTENLEGGEVEILIRNCQKRQDNSGQDNEDEPATMMICEHTMRLPVRTVFLDRKCGFSLNKRINSSNCSQHEQAIVQLSRIEMPQDVPSREYQRESTPERCLRSAASTAETKSTPKATAVKTRSSTESKSVPETRSKATLEQKTKSTEPKSRSSQPIRSEIQTRQSLPSKCSSPPISMCTRSLSSTCCQLRSTPKSPPRILRQTRPVGSMPTSPPSPPVTSTSIKSTPIISSSPPPSIPKTLQKLEKARNQPDKTPTTEVVESLRPPTSEVQSATLKTEVKKPITVTSTTPSSSKDTQHSQDVTATGKRLFEVPEIHWQKPNTVNGMVFPVLTVFIAILVDYNKKAGIFHSDFDRSYQPTWTSLRHLEPLYFITMVVSLLVMVFQTLLKPENMSQQVNSFFKSLSLSIQTLLAFSLLRSCECKDSYSNITMPCIMHIVYSMMAMYYQSRSHLPIDTCLDGVVLLITPFIQLMPIYSTYCCGKAGVRLLPTMLAFVLFITGALCWFVWKMESLDRFVEKPKKPSISCIKMDEECVSKLMEKGKQADRPRWIQLNSGERLCVSKYFSMRYPHYFGMILMSFAWSMTVVSIWSILVPLCVWLYLDHRSRRVDQHYRSSNSEKWRLFESFIPSRIIPA